jgi:hypothetical protein
LEVLSLGTTLVGGLKCRLATFISGFELLSIRWVRGLNTRENSLGAIAERRPGDHWRDRGARRNIILIFPLAVVSNNLLSAGAERSKQTGRLLEFLRLLDTRLSVGLVFARIASCFLEIIAKVLNNTSKLKLFGLLTVEQTSLTLDGSLSMGER